MKAKKLVIHDSEELLKDPKWIKALTKRDSLAEETALILIEARWKMNISQSQLAKKIGTTQSVIARAESGRSMPGLSFIERVAKAYKTNVRIVFDSMPDVVPMAIRYAYLAKPKAAIPASPVAKAVKDNRVSVIPA
jgi:transcriptional regulator with XRE-family HTH domain